MLFSRSRVDPVTLLEAKLPSFRHQTSVDVLKIRFRTGVVCLKSALRTLRHELKPPLASRMAFTSSGVIPLGASWMEYETLEEIP
jgi:hypothetical protein